MSVIASSPLAIAALVLVLRFVLLSSPRLKGLLHRA